MQLVRDGGDTDTSTGMIGGLFDSVTRYRMAETSRNVQDFIQEVYFPATAAGGLSNPVLAIQSVLNDWTLSFDLGGIGTRSAAMSRGSVSIAVDHEAGLAIMASGGGGGTTPFNGTMPNGMTDIGITVTNADSVSQLGGTAVQVGGYIMPEVVGILGEI